MNVCPLSCCTLRESVIRVKREIRFRANRLHMTCLPIFMKALKMLIHFCLVHDKFQAENNFLLSAWLFSYFFLRLQAQRSGHEQKMEKESEMKREHKKNAFFKRWNICFQNSSGRSWEEKVKRAVPKLFLKGNKETSQQIILEMPPATQYSCDAVALLSSAWSSYWRRHASSQCSGTETEVI